ncbi:sigma-70 family RNA polymerase sigma factor [Granulosicoccus sp. 3-233]|uniref:sigma-70 family RNA polymerase sigma factor n=1 Tax=Granulosicoccus sp. 3-233 TaxID=3417969 RepID=UPI003D353BC3
MANTRQDKDAEASIALRKRMGDNLLRVGRDRDESAFADFYNYYAGRVKSFLMGKGMTEEISDELMQEIMLIVWRRAESYDPAKAAASTWLFTIARNRRIDFLRGNSRIEVELEDEMLDVDVDESDTQAGFVDAQQASERLHRALERLPQEQRQVMHLSYFRGQSHGDIAEWLDLPIGTVKSRIRLAMQAVRSSLKDEDIAAAPPDSSDRPLTD